MTGVEELLREYTATLLDGISCYEHYETSETDELIGDYVPQLMSVITGDMAFDNAMLRMRNALKRNEELRNLVKMRDERIEMLERQANMYKDMAKALYNGGILFEEDE